MSKSKVTAPILLQPDMAGRSLKEVGVDYIQVEEQQITSRWFHGQNEVDLFVWVDQNSNVIKQQLSLCGQIVEWNALDGLKTGLVIEEEIATEDKKKSESSEMIRFDRKPIEQAVQLAVAVLENLQSVEEAFRTDLLQNFGATPLRKGSRASLGFLSRIASFFKKSA